MWKPGSSWLVTCCQGSRLGPTWKDDPAAAPWAQGHATAHQRRQSKAARQSAFSEPAGLDVVLTFRRALSAPCDNSAGERVAGVAKRAPAQVPGAETLQEAAGRAGRLAGLAGGTAKEAAGTAGQLVGRAAGATREAAGAAGETARTGAGGAVVHPFDDPVCWIAWLQMPMAGRRGTLLALLTSPSWAMCEGQVQVLDNLIMYLF